ncbi:Fructosamine kinase [Synechococcus sp. MIT S9509]|uniref:fructosamine kinase family protein n=1 Tax=unclassified Synechococcus TaxID=2626047 RepID=UPI0007BC326F|nr:MULTISPECIES: fructosamine kinase family protein [unclassified Synechococcus]KZR86351.1 Fructosamine kinase [Synechococcus sp. MIT S9504]KZR93511.1 Fructosamine kinase [Synechococcus sp. MIT S9509]
MRDQLERALAADAELLEGRQVVGLRSVGGGSVGSTWRLSLSDGEQLFVKVAQTANLLAEQSGLQALRHWADPALIEVPQVLGCLPLAGKSALVMAWWDASSGDQFRLGRGLAQLHRASAAAGPGCFGWDHDGFIGLGPQPSGWCDSWGEAFTQLRLQPQLCLASEWGLAEQAWEPLLGPIAAWLNRHAPEPCLVHGDLWAGNAGVLADGRGLLIDPASWWADREVDLAMTRLFGGFSCRLMEGYSSEWPLQDGAEHRIEVLNLYHLLNHANLFGGGYKQQSREILKDLRLALL